jgi:hypothetical protein
MQKVESSSLFIRLTRKPRPGGAFAFPHEQSPPAPPYKAKSK